MEPNEYQIEKFAVQCLSKIFNNITNPAETININYNKNISFINVHNNITRKWYRWHKPRSGSICNVIRKPVPGSAEDSFFHMRTNHLSKTLNTIHFLKSQFMVMNVPEMQYYISSREQSLDDILFDLNTLCVHPESLMTIKLVYTLLNKPEYLHLNTALFQIDANEFIGGCIDIING